ncbi:MAG: MaoC family dehydratase N-terminal domain-containing protein [Desulfobacterales bacterium]|nr:MAG: MaoC family dehydratase N-terminal domain-containing protein [Desulfobacterales bacterium]
MALNLDLIAKKTEKIPFTYDQDDVILYALGIGAGVEELDFIYEKNLKVFPTYAVIPLLPCMMTLMADLGLNLPAVLHGEQKTIVHAAIPSSGTVYTSGICDAVYDKGDKGAVLNLSLETHDASDQLLFENKVVLIDRSAGNFGGERGLQTERFDPPEGQSPDFRVEYPTSSNQAALYRLSGDKNPLHIDPAWARRGGLERPILHGLCTFGHAGRAILHAVGASDPARFKSFAARFMNVVFPDETLITEGWKRENGRYIIRVKTPDGKVVLGNAVAEVGST